MSWATRTWSRVLTTTKKVAGTVWAAPWSGAAFATTLGPLWAARQISYHSTDTHHAAIRYVAREGTQLQNIYPGHYWGVTLGSFQLYSDAFAVERLASHENVHTRQAWALGPFFPLLYAGAHLVLLVDKKDWEDAYRANPFEEHARRND